VAFVNTLLAILVLGVGLAIVALMRARSATRGAYRDVDGRPIEPLRGADADLLQALAARGVDLSAPLVVHCILSVPAEAAARATSERLQSHDFRAVRWDVHGAGFRVYATTSLVPTVAALATLRADLEGLSVSVGGTFEGWATDAAR